MREGNGYGWRRVSTDVPSQSAVDGPMPQSPHHHRRRRHCRPRSADRPAWPPRIPAEIELLEANTDLVERQRAVAEPFGAGPVRRFDLVRIAADHGAASAARPARVGRSGASPPSHRAGRHPGLRRAARSRGRHPRHGRSQGALTFSGPRDVAAVHLGCWTISTWAACTVWPSRVPTVRHLGPASLRARADDRRARARHGTSDVGLVVVTPEHRPLEAFGTRIASHMLEPAGRARHRLPRPIPFRFAPVLAASSSPTVSPSQVDRIVSLPRLVGPWIGGLPHDGQGFLATDAHGAVLGIEAVWAAGDGTSFPHQAGWPGGPSRPLRRRRRSPPSLGAEVQPEPFRPVLRGMLLDPTCPRFLDSRRGDVPTTSLWQPPTKVAAPHLWSYLAPGTARRAGRRRGGDRRRRAADPAPERHATVGESTRPPRRPAKLAKCHPPSPPRARRPPEDVLAHMAPGADVIVPLANGEPVALLDALEARRRARCEGVRVHQMHALHDRPVPPRRVRRPPCATSPTSCPRATREAYWDGGCDLVPNHFTEMPRAAALEHALLAGARRRHAARPPRLLHLGTNADYVAALIGQVPFFLEVNAADAAHVRPQPAPRLPGARLLRGRPAAGRGRARRCPTSATRRSPPASSSASPTARRSRSASAAIPNAVLAALRDHRDLGIHTELLSDGDRRPRRARRGHRHAQAAAPQQGRGHLRLGTQRLYDCLTTTRRRDAARRLRQRPARDRPRARLRLDQRHHRGRPLRPVRLGDDRRALLVLERRPGRLRPRRDVRRGRAGVRRAALDHAARAAAASACA